MEIERTAGTIMQVGLLVVWFFILVLISKVHLNLGRAAMNRPNREMAAVGDRVKRSFRFFAFGFMPVLALILPAFVLIPPADPVFVPAALAWFVLLIFGALQFYLNLVPARMVLTGGGGLASPDTARKVAAAESSSVREHRRNV